MSHGVGRADAERVHADDLRWRSEGRCESRPGGRRVGACSSLYGQEERDVRVFAHLRGGVGGQALRDGELGGTSVFGALPHRECGRRHRRDGHHGGGHAGPAKGTHSAGLCPTRLQEVTLELCRVDVAMVDELGGFGELVPRGRGRPVTRRSPASSGPPRQVVGGASPVRAPPSPTVPTGTQQTMIASWLSSTVAPPGALVAVHDHQACFIQCRDQIEDCPSLLMICGKQVVLPQPLTRHAPRLGHQHQPQQGGSDE